MTTSTSDWSFKKMFRDNFLKVTQKLQTRDYVVPVVALLLGVVLWLNQDDSKQPVTTASEGSPIDTYIPLGYQLIPITVVNREALDSLISDRAIVDLYRNDQMGKTEKAAAGVRLIRAPLNPRQFAVLVTEKEGEGLLRGTDEFTVVVQNRNFRGSTIERKKIQRRIEIVHEGDAP